MISVSVYRDELVKHNACKDGLALFDAVLAQCGPKSRSKKRVYIREWTQLHAIWLRLTHRSFAIWAEDRGIIPRADLSDADLSGADLSGADLSGANLRYANLRYANLSGANLTRANLTRANLSSADLYGANLSSADLSGANLTRAYRGPSSAIPGWRTSVSGYLERET